jgi:hypothetical protein
MPRQISTGAALLCTRSIPFFDHPISYPDRSRFRIAARVCFIDFLVYSDFDLRFDLHSAKARE